MPVVFTTIGFQNVDIPAPQRPRRRRFRFFRSVSALVLREMATTYGRSPGGYIWAILEPVAMIALMSIVFGLLLRAPSLGVNFPFFYATGFLPFILFMTVSQQIAASIRFSKPLLAYPAVTFMDALLARMFLNTLTQLLVFVIVMAGIVQIYNLSPILNWMAIFTSAAMAISLAFGVGVMNCFLASRFALWDRVWKIAMRPLFLLSAVIFIPENIPRYLRDYLMLNPLAHITSEMRKGFYSTYDAVYVSPVFVFIISVVTGIIGLIFLLRYYRDILQL